MNLVFYFGHPAHYHLFKNSIKILESHKHNIKIVIKPKDILIDLLHTDNIDYIKISGRNKNTRISLLSDYIIRLYNYYKYLKSNNCDLLIGTSWENAQLGAILGIPSLTLNEDDAEAVPLFSRFCYPFTSVIMSPETCSVGRWINKKVSYLGYHELAYLDPKYFIPKREYVDKYFDSKKTYYILRLASLNAHHDKGKSGIDNNLVNAIIPILLKKGNVYITSENQLNSEFESFKLEINPNDIHHVLSYADLYIGDSQTMAAEAAVLGTPSIRYNDFVGKLGYLEELEKQYGLTYGIKTTEQYKLIQKIEELLAISDLKKEWKRRKENMLKQKIDVTSFIVWFIENYPESRKILFIKPDYQLKFI